MNKVTTRYKFFSINGLTARVLILMSKITPEPADVIVAACFGIVEMLGVKRLWKILGPALKQQLKQQFRDLTRRGGGGGNA